jgi:hypothetical protein
MKRVRTDGSDDSKKKSLLEDDHEDGQDGLLKPAEEMSTQEKVLQKLTALYADAMHMVGGVMHNVGGLPKTAKIAILVGAALGLILATSLTVTLTKGRAPMFPSNLRVAFVGNSYFYVNDLPRFVEKIGHGHIYQDSVLHNGASILEIIMTGNGMWKMWATPTAMINGVKFQTSQGNTAYLYDMGACSVPQLLTGHDQLVTSGNALGSFVNDGSNPCFQQDAYLEYQESTDLKKNWDFVVLTDQAKRMAFDETRHEALAAFNYTYGPILKKKKISPIIVQPHAYQSYATNQTGLGDLPTFTALIMEGAHIYEKYLNQRMGWFTKAHVAPVGNAFLTVWEADRSLYKKLFLEDGIHPSGYGTYLYGLVIYATMTGYMPRYKDVVVNDIQSRLFGTARSLQASSSYGFPSKEEASILFSVAKRVAIRGYKPKSLRGFKPEVDATEFIEGEVSQQYYDGAYSDYNTYNYYGQYAQYEYGEEQQQQQEDQGYYNEYQNDYYYDENNAADNNNGENAQNDYQYAYGGNYGNNGGYGGNYGNNGGN